MNMRHQIIIPCQPANPVDYLACCGLADLLARMDHTARTHWRNVAPLAFVMESALTEAEFLATLLATFRTVSRWNFIAVRDSEEPARIEVEFTPGGSNAFTVPLDWWYETLTPTGDIAEKSAWKMYAGQQTVRKITTDMIGQAATIPEPASIAALLTTRAPMSGRFGFDPRSSRDAINAGFSSNDLGLPVDTYPYAELLVTFGAGAFFPSRCRHAGDLTSARGWRGRGESRAGFAYHLWPLPLPALLARLAASPVGTPGAPLLLAGRATRKNYSNFLLAQPTTKQTHE
jgi:CRISPR-associated protein Csb3